MGKTGKWFKSFLTGKKDKEKHKEKENFLNNHNSSTTATENQNPATPIATRPTTPREKKRWSFRRSSATAATPKDLHPKEPAAAPQPIPQTAMESKNEHNNNDITVDETTNTATETVAVIQPAEDMDARAYAIEEAAATMIQSVFRSYLARKALRALKGLVKLQALVRGHLVRRQATATLRCMQALVTVQAKVRAQRLRMAEETKFGNHRQSHRKSTQDYSLRDAYQEMEENIKIVEMDLGDSKGSTKSRSSYSNYPHMDKSDHRFSTHYAPNQAYSKDDNCQVSPTPSALTDMSPRFCSGHYEDYSFNTAQSSPQCYSAISKPDSSRIPFSFPPQDFEDTLSYDYPLFPNYMANTQSSRAKARSQSAPKSRPDSFERQPSRRRPSVEGRNIPRAMRMQRSSSHVGAAAQNYQYPWSVRLDKSNVSLKESECGSTSTVLTNITHCRSLAGYDPRGSRY